MHPKALKLKSMLEKCCGNEKIEYEQNLASERSNIKSRLISSGGLVILITKCLISNKGMNMNLTRVVKSCKTMQTGT